MGILDWFNEPKIYTKEGERDSIAVYVPVEETTIIRKDKKASVGKADYKYRTRAPEFLGETLIFILFFGMFAISIFALFNAVKIANNWEQFGVCKSLTPENYIYKGVDTETRICAYISNESVYETYVYKELDNRFILGKVS